MASATINWTPAGGTSTGQRVEYRVKSVGGSWTVFSTVSATVNTATITGLADNTVYEFRVVNLCSGGEIASFNVEGINQTCVTPSNAPTSTSTTVSFPHLGGEVSKYNIKLYANTTPLTLITSVDKTGPFTGGSTVSHTFTGLTAATVYVIMITPYVGTYALTNCATFDFLTVAPTCGTPTSVTASLS
jgi:hypothetical protein